MTFLNCFSRGRGEMDGLANFAAVLILVSSLFFIMSRIARAKDEYDITIIIHRKRVLLDVTVEQEEDQRQ